VTLTASSKKSFDVRELQPVVYRDMFPERFSSNPWNIPSSLAAGIYSSSCALIIGHEKASPLDLKTSLNDALSRQ